MKELVKKFVKKLLFFCLFLEKYFLFINLLILKNGKLQQSRNIKLELGSGPKRGIMVGLQLI